MENQPKLRPNSELKLMEQLREVLRYYHYAYRTEDTYCRWIRRYIRFYGNNIHPGELNSKHTEKYLSYLGLQKAKFLPLPNARRLKRPCFFVS